MTPLPDGSTIRTAAVLEGGGLNSDGLESGVPTGRTSVALVGADGESCRGRLNGKDVALVSSGGASNLFVGTYVPGATQKIWIRTWNACLSVEKVTLRVVFTFSQARERLPDSYVESARLATIPSNSCACAAS